MGFYIGLVLVFLVFASWVMTRQIREFIYNPIESLADYLNVYVKSDTTGKKDSSWDRDGPSGELEVGDYYLFHNSPPSTDGSFSFSHVWFRTTAYFEKAKVSIEEVKIKQKEHIRDLIIISTLYLILGILSLIVIVYFLLHWLVG